MDQLKDLLSLNNWQSKLPNWLTLTRIAVIPVLLVVFPLNFFILNIFCAILFGFGAFTDFLDGYFARRYSSSTKIGAILDPIADKLLVATGLILLVDAQTLPAWMVGILIGREIAISGMRLVALEQKTVIEVNSFGKAKTCFQDIAIFCLLLDKNILSINFHLIGMLTIWVALGLSLYSAYLYFLKFWQNTNFSEK
jgi:CDP-diacylglycerol---glycerol-3-phosphate 3-phosphatidyltransferase